MVSDTRPTVLVVNHNRTDRCGVYQMGKAIVDILQGSEEYRFVGVRCDTWEAFVDWYERLEPRVCLYNYYPGTMDWVPDCTNAVDPRCEHVGLAHEVTHADAHAPRPPFSRWVVTDPSFPESEVYFKTVRPVPSYAGTAQPPADGPVVIGSFGYAFPNKGFEHLVGAVVAEFGAGATLRLHLTRPHFDGGVSGRYLAAWERWASSSAAGAFGADLPRVELTTDHWDDATLLDWLASNHLNCLFYDPNPGRGVSSAVDWCVAAGRPLAITESEQFRHITGLLGTWPKWSLRDSLELAADGHNPVNLLRIDWSHANFIRDYEGIIGTLLGGSE